MAIAISTTLRLLRTKVTNYPLPTLSFVMDYDVFILLESILVFTPQSLTLRRVYVGMMDDIPSQESVWPTYAVNDDYHFAPSTKITKD